MVVIYKTIIGDTFNNGFSAIATHVESIQKGKKSPDSIPEFLRELQDDYFMEAYPRVLDRESEIQESEEVSRKDFENLLGLLRKGSWGMTLIF